MRLQWVFSSLLILVLCFALDMFGSREKQGGREAVSGGQNEHLAVVVTNLLELYCVQEKCGMYFSHFWFIDRTEMHIIVRKL